MTQRHIEFLAPLPRTNSSDIFTFVIGSDEIEPTNDETSDLEETDYDDEQILRIETNMFNYETPLCENFKKFNYLLKIGPDVLTNDIKGFKTYEEYKDDWIYEWNENVAWDYEWYEALEDKELKEEALRNKAIVEGTIDDDEEQEICSNKTHKLSVCNIRRLEMIKYLFRDDEEYVTIKEDEYETSTSKDACQAYQEIFRMVDEGWMDLVESKEIDEVDEVSII
nr:hypothetical protein [Tanacetum cinerariifolium]